MQRTRQRGDADERGLLTGWLAFHRDVLAATGEGLTDEQLMTASRRHFTFRRSGWSGT
jgi:hypothetical protein